jgi:hypothetical protein
VLPAKLDNQSPVFWHKWRKPKSLVRSAISDSAVRPVVIVLFDPTSDRCSRFFLAPILHRPDFVFFQVAMEAFNVAVALRDGRSAARKSLVAVFTTDPEFGMIATLKKE